MPALEFVSCGYWRRGGAKIVSPCVDHVESRHTCSPCNCNGGNGPPVGIFISALDFSHNFLAADVVICKNQKENTQNIIKMLLHHENVWLKLNLYILLIEKFR